MKPFLPFFLLIGQTLLCQKYQPFDTNMVWNSYLADGYCYKTYQYQVHGYLVNNNRLWHRVSATTTFNPCGASPQFVSNSFTGLFSNDTLGRKVYFVNTPTLAPGFVPNQTNVLFDFNLKMGDTIRIPNSPLDNRYKISVIDSVLVGNKYHKIYKAFNMTATTYTCTPLNVWYIEGVGATIGVFSLYHSCFSGISNLLKCFSLFNNAKYIAGTFPDFLGNRPKAIRDTTSCEQVLTGLNEFSFQNSRFLMYPLPADNILNIEAGSFSEGLELTIHNNLGQTLFEQNMSFTQGRATISTETYPPGVYFLSIRSNNSESFTRKFVVAR